MDINSGYADKANKLRPIDFRYRIPFHMEELLWNNRLLNLFTADFPTSLIG
jgi:hypothetical protein